MLRKNFIVTTVMPFVSIGLISNLLLTFQGIIILKLVSPAVMGVWLALQLIQNYGIQFHFGILNGMSRQIPLYIGKDMKDFACRIESVARQNIFILSLIALAIVLFLFVTEIFSSEMKIFVCSMILITIIRLNMEFHIALFKAKQQFNKASMVIASEAILMLLSLPLVYYMDLNGLILRSLICAICLLLLSFKLNNWTLEVKKNLSITKEIIYVGFPIMVLGLALVVYGSMDRLMILKFLDTESLGFYSIGLAVASVLSLIPAFTGQSFYPKMVEIFGSKGICKEMIMMCTQASLISFFVTFIGIVFIYFFLPIFIEFFLESYVSGISAMKIILLSGLSLSITSGPNYFIIASEQKFKQIGMIGLVIILIFLLSSKLSYLGLEGILWSVVIGSFAYMIGLWFIVLTSFIKTIKL